MVGDRGGEFVKARESAREEWRDVLSFAEETLGLALYSWQAQILDVIDYCSERSRAKVALVAPNGSGKTQRIVGVAVLWWLSRYRAGRVIVTTADSKQLDFQLMPALRAKRDKFMKWGFLHREIRTEAGGFALGFCTDEPKRAEGHHSRPDSPVLVIIDEAKAVETEIFEAIDRCSYNVLLLISSPGLKMGRFYDAFTKYRDDYYTFEVGLADCPHVSGERIKDVTETYGEDHPLTRSTLYGEFMQADESAVFAVDYNRLKQLIENPPHPRLTSEMVGFCDFGGGQAENVLAIRRGNKLVQLVAWRDHDTVAAVGRFIMEFRKFGLSAGQVWCDAGGAGQVMADLMASAGWALNRFYFGARAIRDDVYVSRGAEVWHSFGLLVQKGEVVLLDDAKLVSQLTTRRTTFDSRTRMGLETKDVMAGKGLESPDRADAVVGAYGVNVGNWLAYTKKPLDAWEELDGALERVGPAPSREEALLRQMGGWVGE
jgi:hypothetical protein